MTSTLRLIATALFALAAAVPAPPALAGADLPPARFVDPERLQKLKAALPRIEALMADGLKTLGTPGLAYAVIIDGEVVLQRSLGLRDVAAGAPVDERTRFRIASMTKSFTALAVLKLRDAGRLRLDDPVAKHVPELRGWKPPTKDSPPITVGMLLAHAAGFPEDNPQGDRQLALTPAQFSAWIKGGAPFSSAPGSAHEYSNLGFMILGRVITNVSQRPYQAYIRDEILKPLGMNATLFSVAAVPQGELALGYRKAADGYAPEPMLEDGEGGAMGGLLTTPGDLARWVGAMLAAWPPRDDGESPPAMRHTLREMQVGQGYPGLNMLRDPVTGARIVNAGSYGYGLGSSVDCLWGREVSHGGGLPGFGSHMRWLPDHGVGVVVLANVRYARAGRLTRGAVQALFDTGALQPRQAQPAPALADAARAVADLVSAWDDKKAEALAADNLLLDEPLAERRAAVAKLRDGLGSCTAGPLVPENALRGEQRLDCERGRLSISVTLAPTLPPTVQYLKVSAVTMTDTPPTAGGPAASAAAPPGSAGNAGSCTR